VVLFRQGDVGEYLREVSIRHKEYIDLILTMLYRKILCSRHSHATGSLFMFRIYRRLGNILGIRPGKVMLDLFS
jgi:hypothetical protein